MLHSDTEAFADCSGTACHNDVDDEARCGRRDRKCRCRVLQGRSGSASHRMIGPRSKSAEARKTSVNRSRCLDATNDRQRHRGQQFRDLQALSGLGAMGEKAVTGVSRCSPCGTGPRRRCAEVPDRNKLVLLLRVRGVDGLRRDRAHSQGVPSGRNEPLAGSGAFVRDLRASARIEQQ